MVNNNDVSKQSRHLTGFLLQNPFQLTNAGEKRGTGEVWRCLTLSCEGWLWYSWDGWAEKFLV